MSDDKSKTEAKKDAKKEDKKDDENFEKPSYTFWKRDSDILADHTGFQPQSSGVKPEEVNKNDNKVGSAWNQAGTWEEKQINKKSLEDFFNDYISKNKKVYKGVFTLDSFSDYSGDVSNTKLYNFSCNKRYLFYLALARLL